MVNALAKTKKKKSGDLLLKIISVLTALVLWFVIIGVDNPIDTRNFTAVPIKLENLSVMESQYNLSIISNSPNSIYTFDITISGREYINPGLESGSFA